ncbi:MAG: DUF4256 domain-containing protein [Firmicutes bacterium]|nr:DUF4256 domain-containing protein [Bacillota bacterium]
MMELLETLKKRFEKNMHRHEGLVFEEVQEKLIQHLDTILKMEQSGGEPDVVVLEDKLYVIDMAKESPKLRGSLCYDKEASLARKNFPPVSSALEMAASLGISLIDEMMYVKLQDIEDFDLKTSSWILTDEKLRSLGGALFGDKRYQRSFIYHNGVDSYYGSRGFRGYITL